MNIERLKELLAEKNITQAQLSEMVGVSQAFISYVLNGYKVPSVAVIKNIAAHLGVSVDELLAE